MTEAKKYASKRVSSTDYPVYNDEYELELAFEEGAKWKRNNIWHKGNDPADDGKEILFEWESFGEKYHDVGYYDKKAKVAHIIGGGRLVLSPTDRWAYLEDLTQL